MVSTLPEKIKFIIEGPTDDRCSFSLPGSALRRSDKSDDTCGFSIFQSLGGSLLLGTTSSSGGEIQRNQEPCLFGSVSAIPRWCSFFQPRFNLFITCPRLPFNISRYIAHIRVIQIGSSST